MVLIMALTTGLINFFRKFAASLPQVPNHGKFEHARGRIRALADAGAEGSGARVARLADSPCPLAR